jgi:hypothetical protein
MPLQQTSGNVTADAYGGGVALKPNYIEDVFSTYLYTGNGSTQTITNGIDLAGKGGLVWLKDRTLAQNNGLYDTVRGATNLLISNQTNAQQTLAQSITSFTSSGFSVGTFPEANQNTDRFASWSFAKAPKFFDVVTYTGNGVTGAGGGRLVSHNLGSKPGFIIVKRTNSTGDWYCSSRQTGSTDYIASDSFFSSYFCLNRTSTGSGIGESYIVPNTTQVDVAMMDYTQSLTNINGASYVMYVFAHNAGGFGLTGTDNVISCGSFTTDATTGNATINLGYEPQWIITKMADGLSDWTVYDNMRGMSLTNSYELFPNSSSSEVNYGSPDIIPSATGFSISYVSGSGQYGKNKNIIYIAIRRGPMKVPTDATKVFNTVTATGGPPVFTSGFVTDMSWTKIKNLTATGFRWVSRLLNGTYSDSSTTAAESALAQYSFDYQNGWRNATVTDSTLLSWSFQRAPNTFDEVCWTGIGTATTQTHNLGVVPELIITKTRSAGSQNWATYVGSLGPTKFLALDLTLASTTDSGIRWNGTAPTSSVFSIGTGNNVNQSGTTYVAYLFATAAGVSKVGSYTGTGATQTINCGFGASGSRFILIKRVDSTGDWYTLDSARGLTSGSSPYLLLNSPAAEVTGNNGCYASSGGFTLTSSASATMNINGASYIFLSYA